MTAMRFLLLASTLVHKTYLCDGGVALETLSQGLASFNTQIIRAGVDLCTLFDEEESEGEKHSKYARDIFQALI